MAKKSDMPDSCPTPIFAADSDKIGWLCHTGAKNRQRKIVTKFVIPCVCHKEGLKSWQFMKKMTHKCLKIVKKN